MPFGPTICSFADNPKGMLYERWLHEYGCGRWFNVARDTVTHEVRAVYRMGDARPMLGPGSDMSAGPFRLSCRTCRRAAL